jgi:hypothetical protein
MSSIRAAGVFLAAALIAAALPAAAQVLKIGLKTEPSSLDPQYHNLGPNNQIASHLFDPLVARDDKQLPTPGLATQWKSISDTVWEFKLRPGVTFHDGSAFTAEDVVFTFERAAKVPNSPSPFTLVTRQMTKLEIVDPLTLRIHTAAAAPLLPARPFRPADPVAQGGGRRCAGRQDHRRTRSRRGAYRHRPLQVRRLEARRGARAGAQRCLLGSQARLDQGDVPAAQKCRRPRRGFARG